MLKALGFQPLELFESKALSKFWFQLPNLCHPLRRGADGVYGGDELRKHGEGGGGGANKVDPSA